MKKSIQDQADKIILEETYLGAYKRSALPALRKTLKYQLIALRLSFKELFKDIFHELKKSFYAFIDFLVNI